MGFNSCLLILNDQLADIAADPEFGRKVARAIMEYGVQPPIPSDITGQTQVISVAHADMDVVLKVGGNTASVLGYGLDPKTGKVLIPAGNQSIHTKYRLLHRNEIIRATDQCLDDDCESWSDLVGWEVGMRYDAGVFKPIRRKIWSPDIKQETK